MLSWVSLALLVGTAFAANNYGGYVEEYVSGGAGAREVLVGSVGAREVIVGGGNAAAYTYQSGYQPGYVESVYQDRSHVHPGREYEYRVRTAPRIHKQVALVGQVVQPKVEVTRVLAPPKVEHVTVVKEQSPEIVRVVPQIHRETVVYKAPAPKPKVFLSERRKQTLAKKIELEQHKITAHVENGHENPQYVLEGVYKNGNGHEGQVNGGSVVTSTGVSGGGYDTAYEGGSTSGTSVGGSSTSTGHANGGSSTSTGYSTGGSSTSTGQTSGFTGQEQGYEDARGSTARAKYAFGGNSGNRAGTKN